MTAGCGCDERPSLRISTVMFTDIEGFTAMIERMGEHAMHRILSEHHRLIRAHLRHCGGSEVSSLGDGFMILFGDANRALDCAAAIQRSLAAASRRWGIALRVRIGVHAGPVIDCNGEYFGRTIIVAARIASLASGGQVLASGGVRDVVDPRFSFGVARRPALKGLRERHEVVDLQWTAARRAERVMDVTAKAPTTGHNHDVSVETLSDRGRRSGDGHEGSAVGRSVRQAVSFFARPIAHAGTS